MTTTAKTKIREREPLRVVGVENRPAHYISTTSTSSIPVGVEEVCRLRLVGLPSLVVSPHVGEVEIDLAAAQDPERDEPDSHDQQFDYRYRRYLPDPVRCKHKDGHDQGQRAQDDLAEPPAAAEADDNQQRAADYDPDHLRVHKLTPLD